MDIQLKFPRKISGLNLPKYYAFHLDTNYIGYQHNNFHVEEIGGGQVYDKFSSKKVRVVVISFKHIRIGNWSDLGLKY